MWSGVVGFVCLLCCLVIIIIIVIVIVIDIVIVMTPVAVAVVLVVAAVLVFSEYSQLTTHHTPHTTNLSLFSSTHQISNLKSQTKQNSAKLLASENEFSRIGALGHRRKIAAAKLVERTCAAILSGG